MNSGLKVNAQRGWRGGGCENWRVTKTRLHDFRDRLRFRVRVRVSASNTKHEAICLYSSIRSIWTPSRWSSVLPPNHSASRWSSVLKPPISMDIRHCRPAVGAVGRKATSRAGFAPLPRGQTPLKAHGRAGARACPLTGPSAAAARGASLSCRGKVRQRRLPALCGRCVRASLTAVARRARPGIRPPCIVPPPSAFPRHVAARQVPRRLRPASGSRPS